MLEYMEMLDQLATLGLVISTTVLAAIGCGYLPDIKNRRQKVTALLAVFALTTLWFTEKSAGHPDLASDISVWLKSPPYPVSNGAIGDNNPSQARYLPELHVGTPAHTTHSTPLAPNSMTIIAK